MDYLHPNDRSGFNLARYESRSVVYTDESVRVTANSKHIVERRSIFRS